MSIKNLQVQSFAACTALVYFCLLLQKNFDQAGPSMIIYMYVVNDRLEKNCCNKFC